MTAEKALKLSEIGFCFDAAERFRGNKVNTMQRPMAMDVEEVQGALVDAKAAAAKLREEGKEEEAAKLDEMVDKLEGALHAQVEAEDLKKEGELVRAAAEASEQASEAAKAAVHGTASDGSSLHARVMRAADALQKPCRSITARSHTVHCVLRLRI